MGVLKHHIVDNDDVDIYPSDYPSEYPSPPPPPNYVTDPDNTLTKSIDDDEMNQLLEIFTWITIPIFTMFIYR